MDDLTPSECCDLKYYPTSQKLFEKWCVFFKLSVVFQHPLGILSSVARSEAEMNLPVSSYKAVSSCLLLLNHSCTSQFKCCLQRRYGK